jgi:hypothetical protein
MHYKKRAWDKEIDPAFFNRFSRCRSSAVTKAMCRGVDVVGKGCGERV